jgi:putative salt-induced outer membrane protein YdiY
LPAPAGLNLEDTKTMPHPKMPLLLALSSLAVVALPAAAQQNATPTDTKAVDAKAFKLDQPGLYANADLSYVLTSGNSRSSALGFRGDLTRRLTRHSISFAAGGIRASSTASGSRYAVGTSDAFDVQVPSPEPTAERYYVNGRWDYKLTDRFFVTGGVGWERNRFSGIDGRWVGDGGLGYVLVANDKTDLRGMAGMTYTDEQYTAGPPASSSFAGLRAGWDLRHQLLATTTLLHTLILDENLQDTSDLRLDVSVGVQVAMTEKLALKANWRLLYDNQPALAEVPLFTPGGVDTGIKVLAPYGKTDQGFSVSLVLSIAPPKKP